MVVLALVLAASACTGAEPGPAPTGAAPVTATEVAPGGEDDTADLARPVVQITDCPPLGEDVEEVDDVECGYLVVPEDRGSPPGQVVEIAWARLPGVPTEDPPLSPFPTLLVLPDGPGRPGLADAAAWIDSPLRDDRDVVLIDPRGTGRSFPRLDCGQPAGPGAPAPDLVEDCRRDLAAEGIDVEAYTTTAAAADVSDLRAALDLDQVDLLGIGHGARVALAVLADHPAAIRAVVLDSPLPAAADPAPSRPESAQSALDRLFDRCAERQTCPSDTARQVEALLETLENPVASEAAGATSMTAVELVVAAVEAMDGLNGPPAVVAAVRAALDGDLSAVTELSGSDAAGDVAEGAQLTVTCGELLPAEPQVDGLAPIGQAVADDISALRQACGSWTSLTGATAGAAVDLDAARAAEAFVLVLAGELDPLSPPAWTARVASALDAAVIEVDGAGHGVLGAHPCTEDIVVQFLTRPAAAPEDACAAPLDGTRR